MAPPDFVLVHGAFADASALSKLAARLERDGAHASTRDLPGHSDASSAIAGSVTFDDYVRVVEATVREADRPVILVGHSMAGMIISQVAEHLPERIAALVYLSAYLPQNGRTLLSYAQDDAGSELGPGLKVDQTRGVATIDAETMRAAFFNDTPPVDADAGVARLRPEPLQPFVAPVAITPQRFGTVVRHYVTTEDDRAVSPPLQKAMYTSSPCKSVRSLKADHSSYLSATEPLAAMLLAIRTETAA